MSKFQLPSLPYAYDALEPYIDTKTMELHHSKHHATYVEKLNTALDGNSALADKPIEELLSDLDAIPEEIRMAVRNHGGGHFNHSLFWEMLTPDFIEIKEGKLKSVIDQTFGSLEEFKTKFNTEAASVFGSGWVWLVADTNKKLSIKKTANQDNPISEDKSVKVLLGVDVWEHAYYLKYQNRRPEYLESFWNVVNWRKVEENYAS